MQIRFGKMRDTLVVRLQGSLTSKDALDLQHQVTLELAANPRDVVLNLTDVPTMEAGALPCLFRLQQEASRNGARFVIAAASDRVRRFFDLTHVTGNLDLVEREEDALHTSLA